MQLVDLARAARMLEPPHPLLGDDMDFERVLRRRQRGELVRCRPPEQNRKLNSVAAVQPISISRLLRSGTCAARHRRAAVIQREENDDQPADQEHDDEPADDR